MHSAQITFQAISRKQKIKKGNLTVKGMAPKYRFAAKDPRHNKFLDTILRDIMMSGELEGVDMVTTYGRKPEEIRRMLDQHGLKTICYTFFVDLIFPDTAGRQTGVDAIRQGIRTG